MGFLRVIMMRAAEIRTDCMCGRDQQWSLSPYRTCMSDSTEMSFFGMVLRRSELAMCKAPGDMKKKKKKEYRYPRDAWCGTTSRPDLGGV
jgi:hypothetical protein